VRRRRRYRLSPERIIVMRHRIAGLTFALAFVCASAGAAKAEDLATYNLRLKNHRFIPTEIHVPNGKPFFVVVANEDDTADEFEMSNPAIEKVIPPGDQGRVRMRPLSVGRFPFVGDFHRDTAQGVIVSE
jgi:hypothetical protein